MADNEIKGLFYDANYLNVDEINTLTNHIANEQHWNSVGTAKNSRQTVQYGWTYDYNAYRVTPTTSIPDHYQSIVSADRINSKFGENIVGNEFGQLIINQYQHQAINPHIDHTRLFGPVIACITIGDERNVVFTKDGQEITRPIGNGSIYIMTGASRYQWKHAFRTTTSKRPTRTSLTFRTVLNKT